MMRRTAATLLPELLLAPSTVSTSTATAATATAVLPKLRIRACSSMASLYPSATASPVTTKQQKQQQQQRKRRPLTLNALIRKYDSLRKLTMVTAYDATMAALAQDAELDMILVGDSLGMVMQGGDSTVPVSLEEVIYHAKAVNRAVNIPFVIGDMPFGTYVTVDDALRSGVRLLKEGGVSAVKLEGGMAQRRKVRALTDEGIAVCGHIGLTPQTVSADGGYRYKGHTRSEQDELMENALALEDAGARMLVLECVPADVAADLTQALSIPTIGIGAGPDTSGQVLVMHDALGLYRDSFKFAKRFVEGHALLTAALVDYKAEVQSGAFPAPDHYVMAKDNAGGGGGGGGNGGTSEHKASRRQPPARTLTSGLGLMGATHRVSQPMSRQYSTAAVVGGGPLGVSTAARMASVMDTVLISDTLSASLGLGPDGGVADIVDTGDTVTLAAAGARRTASPTTISVVPTDGIGSDVAADLVVSCVSGHGVPKAGAVAGALLRDRDDGCVVSLTNGMGHGATLSTVSGLASDTIIEAATYDAARMTTPAAATTTTGRVSVTRTGLGPTHLVGGPGVHGHKFRRAATAAHCLTTAGFDASLEADATCLWTKLVVNTVINPLTTLFRVPNGGLVQWLNTDAGAYSYVQSLVEEGVRVASRAGVTMDERAVMGTVMATAAATARNTSSMLTAALGGRPTEMEWLNGFLIREAKSAGVATPGHDVLVQAVNSATNHEVLPSGGLVTGFRFISTVA